MSKTRLEAFSDAVIAIAITIMVLEIKVPHEVGVDALYPLLPVFVSYVLSFVHLGIYWNNHHHMLHAAGRINGAVLWANLHLLFWLSLVPFTTGWMGENSVAAVPAALYGIVLLMAALSWTILQGTIIRSEREGSKLAEAVGNDFKGKLSLALYVVGIGLAFVNPWISICIYGLVALMWLVPDRRIEAKLGA